jgi:hypothetical protein
MNRAWIALVIPALLLAAGCLPTERQDAEIHAHGGPSCGACRIELAPVATIGSPDDEHLYQQFSRLVRDSGTRYYVAAGFTPGAVLVYDSTGAFKGLIGSPGRGPGEISGHPDIQVTPEDSLLVLTEGRIDVYGPSDASPARSWRLDVAVWGLTALKGGVVAGERGPNLEHETVRIFGPDGSHQASLTHEGPLEHRDQLAQRVFAAGDTLILVSDTGRYRIRAFDQNARVVWTLTRKVDWFEPYARQPPMAPFGTPSRPEIVGAWVESDRYLWVLLERSAPEWAPLAPEFRRPDMFDMNQLLGSHLEVIDLETGEVMASRRTQWLRPADGGSGLLHSTRVEADGRVVFEIWKPVLKTRTEA